MGPYTKTRSKAAIDDGWRIADGTGEGIAYLDTELLADVVMNFLVNGVGDNPPDFVIDEPYGEGDNDVNSG